jgi:hypothetical protein
MKAKYVNTRTDVNTMLGQSIMESHLASSSTTGTSEGWYRKTKYVLTNESYSKIYKLILPLANGPAV